MTNLPCTITVHYNEAMLRSAVSAFMRRRVLRPRGAGRGIALLIGSGVGLGWGAGPIFGFGLVGGLMLLAGIMAFVIWRAHLQNTLGRLRALNPPTALLTLRDGAMTMDSNLGSATIPWSRWTERWELDSFWMLFTAQNSFITLPTADLQQDAQAFIRSRIPVGGPA